MDTTFSDLNLSRFLLNALEELEYTYPTPIQNEAFPVIMSGKDVIGIAQTGTGKTFAYLLPILRQLKFSNQKNPRVLILVPTRELVAQLESDIESLSTYMTVRTGGVYGGTNINTQKRIVLGGLDILVATPGRLLDLALHGALKLSSIQKLVIDEVDEMLNLGFRTQLTNILDILPERRQNLLFSATMTEEVEKLIEQFVPHSAKIEIAKSGTPIERIVQTRYDVPNFNSKVNLLEHLIRNDEDMSRVLTFVSTKKMADRLYDILEAKFPGKTGVIHSNKSQNQRFAAIEKFDSKESMMLIATDIIARGLDIKELSHVINFEMPEIPTNYMHRIGRTGRADMDGNAISFVTEHEGDHLEAIEELMNHTIDVLDWPENVPVSNKLLEEEKTQVLGKNYLKNRLLTGQGAYHEKSEKNQKVNKGGSYRTKLKAKYKKPQRRSGKKK